MLNSMQVTGYVDISTLEIGVRVDVFGAHIFNLFGNLKDGVVGKIDLFLAKGEIRFFLKNGNGTIHFQHFAMKTVLSLTLFVLQKSGCTYIWRSSLTARLTRR
jgi:hypothetical protein